MLYGRSHMIALRSSQGFFCYRWMFSDQVSAVLFVDNKTAKGWLKNASKEGYDTSRLTPQIVSALPEGLRGAINPSSDVADLRRIFDHVEWRN